MAMMDDEIVQRLHSGKEDLLHRVRLALELAGLHEYEVQSIQLNLKHVRKCPSGEPPVWGPVTKPDGSVVYEWKCS